MRRIAVLNVVGLTPSLLDLAPFLKGYAEQGGVATIEPVLPAVTCTMQATYLTGTLPERHGVVANGWYDHDDSEVKFWKQSNRLVQQPKLWDKARDLNKAFSCTNLFWWYNMYSTVDVSVTPRPMYPADGRKIPDIYTEPAGLRFELQHALGRFPLFNYWGPTASIASSRWITDATKIIEEKFSSTLTLVYLPHLDYSLQRLGPLDPGIRGEVIAVDDLCRELVTFLESRGVEVVVLSEYGISPVRDGLALNRLLRRRGYIRVREELGRELLDPGACKAFAVADHQVAHVYVQDKSVLSSVRTLLERVDGVAEVLDKGQQRELGLAHNRSGDLLVVAEPDLWFSYYYWFEDRRAPDFARTVDIHRKPGYDPAELFIDPSIAWPKLRAGRRLLQKRLGFRYLMDLIPLDSSLVRGSHGHIPKSVDNRPLFITPSPEKLGKRRELPATEVHDLLLRHLFDGNELGQRKKRTGERAEETH